VGENMRVSQRSAPTTARFGFRCPSRGYHPVVAPTGTSLAEAGGLRAAERAVLSNAAGVRNTEHIVTIISA